MKNSLTFPRIWTFSILFGMAFTHPANAQQPTNHLRSTTSDASHVTVQESGGRFQLLRNGKPYRVKGAGAESHYKELAEAGANSFRTWNSEELGPILDQAQKLGLTVSAGLWLGHQRHGFNYQSQQAVMEQLEQKLAIVRQHKDHPALLMWGVGNEAEGNGDDPSVWYAIDHLAREIKKIDPNHPTMTVIAELGEGESKLHSIQRFCPNIDVVGINSYGGIETVGERFRNAKLNKPYIVTEHGPLGPWEVGKTSWGSPLELTSTEKAEFYANGYRANAVEYSDICLGTYAFLWGHKQETTATWFGMLLSNGRHVATVDAMTEAWTGKAPVNRCPKIETIELEGSDRLKPGETVQAAVTGSDPDNDKIRYEWVLRSDSATIGEGGDPQSQESAVEHAVKASGNRVVVTAPKGGGGYRLFAYVYDAHGGAAVANVPLFVSAKIELPNVMKASPIPYVVYGDEARNSAYIPSGYMGNADAVKMQLDCSESPFQGKTCIKAEYTSGGSWGGVLWQSPAEDWDGKLPGGANLTGATALEFYARGESGGETINFVFGVLDGNQPYRDTAKGELSDIKLGTSWEKYTIPLDGMDLRQIKTGFGWSLAGQEKPVTFYLDEIRYVK